MKKSFFLLVCSLAYFLTPLQLQSQEKSSFSLQEAIDYALKHNLNVKNSDLSIEAAKKQKWETTAIGLPQLNGEIAYQHQFKQQFPAIDFNGDGAIDFGAKHSLTPSATLTQLIFDGSYLVGLQSAKVFLDISKNAKIKTDIEIKKAVTNAYSNVLLTNESKKIVENNISSISDNINETSKLLDNGLVEEESLEQLQLTLSNLENNYNNLLKLETISKKYLKLLMEYEKEDIQLNDDLNDLLTNSLGEKTQISVFNNIDYLIAENDNEAKRLLYKLELAKKLPSLSSYLSGNYIGNSNSFSFFENDQKWVPTLIGGISLNIPIFSSLKNTARTKRAKIEWKKSQNQLSSTQKEIQIKIDNAQTELEFATETLENKKNVLSLAEKIERKNSIKYKEGLASSFELRQAQMQLYSSQNEYLQAMVEVINKKAQLESLTK